MLLMVVPASCWWSAAVVAQVVQDEARMPDERAGARKGTRTKLGGFGWLAVENGAVSITRLGAQQVQQVLERGGCGPLPIACSHTLTTCKLLFLRPSR